MQPRSPLNSAAPAEEKWLRLPSAQLAERIEDARRRLLELVDDLSDQQWTGTPTAISNPIRWEVGHVAHFYGTFLLAELGRTDGLIEDGNALYNSFLLGRDDRWAVTLPGRRGTLEYLRHVTWYALDWLHHNEPNAWQTYLFLTAVLHEEMHIEAITWYRQVQACPAPAPDRAPAAFSAAPHSPSSRQRGPLPGDAQVAAGTYYCGATPDQPYAWDNEKWAHPVHLPDFRIARAPVTQGEFAEFVDAGGYGYREFWDLEGWRWRSQQGVTQPLYWRRDGGAWLRRHYAAWLPLEANQPMVYVNWHEANAYCRWAQRRLPHEAEWEAAASGPAPGDAAEGRKRPYPWGADDPDAPRALLDANEVGCADVAARPAGDSAVGCRQMIGNVWEWTASAFYPYPGYVVDHPYREYSAPWFGNHRVLRGGSWATRSHVIRNTYRNFFQPDRRDIIAGFRTCAI